MKVNQYTVSPLALSIALAAALVTTAAPASVVISGSETYRNSAGGTEGTQFGPQRDFSATSGFFGPVSARSFDISASDTPEDRSMHLSGQFATLNGAGAGPEPDQLTQTVEGLARADIFDTLMLSGAPTASGKVTLHMLLQLDVQQISSAEYFNGDTHLPDNGNYNISGNDFVTVNSSNANITGTKSSDLDFIARNGSFNSSGIGGVRFTSILNFDLEMDFNNPSSFDLQLIDRTSQSMVESSPTRSPFGASAGNNVSLKFLDGISITDDSSGQQLCGLTVSKISGELWGQTASCSGGSGGGGSGGGAGNVPEPASWALMLAGFGLVGGAMRASERKTPAPRC